MRCRRWRCWLGRRPAGDSEGKIPNVKPIEATVTFGPSPKPKEAIRPYWSQGLAGRQPLSFELLDVSVAIYYRSVTRSRLVVERVEFNSQRRAIRAEALYRTG